MHCYTVQMSQWRKVRASGIILLDTTVKSGDPVFAPTWDLVLGFRNGHISDDAYTKHYYDLMRQSSMHHRARWLDVANSEAMALACYCPVGKFCHRHLLVDLFERVCASYGLPFHRGGEIC